MPKKYASKKIGTLELRTLRSDMIENCIIDHPKTKMLKQATHSITIAGWPAGFLCKPCMNEWIKIWEEALEICPR